MESLFNPFEGMDRVFLLRQKSIYEGLINEHSADYIPPISKKIGKRIKPTLMPWMLPIWSRGLELVIDQLKKYTSQ